jgi:hypothetical protein
VATSGKSTVINGLQNSDSVTPFHERDT